MSAKKESGSTVENNKTNIHETLALADLAKKLIREAKQAMESDQPPDTELSEQSCLYIKELAERLKVW